MSRETSLFSYSLFLVCLSLSSRKEKSLRDTSHYDTLLSTVFLMTAMTAKFSDERTRRIVCDDGERNRKQKVSQPKKTNWFAVSRSLLSMLTPFSFMAFPCLTRLLFLLFSVLSFILPSSSSSLHRLAE